MPTQTKQNKSDNGVSVPERFEPRFWETSDGRCALVKEVRKRYEQLKDDTGTDTYQKDLLCQRAIFIAIQLETMEVLAMETGRLDVGIYTQACNALSGLLSKLGLERRSAKMESLQAYVSKRDA